jgi:hypothetical protein
MKLRHRRKLALAQIRHNNAWNWSFDKFVRAVVAAWQPAMGAAALAYAKAREQNRDHAG